MRMKSPYHDFTTPDECGMIENVMNLAGGNVFPKDEYYAPNQYDITTCKLLIYPVSLHSTLYLLTKMLVLCI